MSSNEANKHSDQSHPPNYPTFNGPYPPPPGAYPPPFYTYAPPADGAHGENGGQPGPQYMMAFPPPPPGMVYAYPPPGQAFYQGQNNGKPSKRKQVKMACTNCAAACKRCDEARPCERCIKYGLTDQCQDGVRKERKKGIKRGPYKRKNKVAPADGSFGVFTQADGDANWQSSSTTPANAAVSGNSGAIHNLPQYPQTPGAEGYYPYYYPPHGYMAAAQPSEPHVPAEHTSTQPGPNGQPPIQYFSVHPAGFTPFPAYPPPPGVPFTPINLPHMHPQQTMDPKKANAASHANRQESEECAEEEESTPGPPPTLVPVPPQPLVSSQPPAPAPVPSQKKRARAARGAVTEPKPKKTKTSKKAGKATAANGNTLLKDGHLDNSDPVVGSKG